VRVLQRPAPHVKENLRHWGREGDKTGRYTSQPWEGNADNTDTVSRGPALKTAGRASRDKMVYCAVY